jgi:hypothetical protein
MNAREEEKLMRSDAEHHADMVASKVFERFTYTIGPDGQAQIAAAIYAEMRNARADCSSAAKDQS